MIERKITVNNESGLHMRPGRLFVQQAKQQECEVTVVLNDKSANGKSLVQLLKLGIDSGKEITLRCEGNEELRAADHLEQFINSLEE